MNIFRHSRRLTRGAVRRWKRGTYNMTRGRRTIRGWGKRK